MAARFQRQQCFLCDLPHSPWAVLHDFSEPICRGCCNYEGADRIEEVIQYVRILRRNWEKAEGNRSRNSKSERLNSTGSSVSSTPSPPPSHGLSNNGGPNFPVSAEHRRMLGKYQNVPKVEDGVDPASYQNVSGPYPKISSPETTNGSKAGGNRAMGNIGGREGERRANFYEDTRHSMLNGSAVRNHQGQVIAPPLGQPHLALEVPRQEYIAHETINILNRTVPFDIRFKKDHNLVGRVFAFDISSKLGQELEMKLLMEYPRGSGCVFQSASRLAKQMHVDSSKEYGRGVSSGFKYIEYEKDRSKGEWRILGELLLESVRLFKEPVIQELLPLRKFEPDDPPIPAVNLSFNPRPGALYGRKRKGTDIDEYEPGRPAGMMGRFTKDDMMHPAAGWVHGPAEYGKLTGSGAVFPGTPISSIPSASVLPMVSTPVTKGNVIPLPVSDGLLHSQTKSPINAVPGRLDESVVGIDCRSALGIQATPASAAGCVSPSCRSPRPPNGPISKSAETQSGGPEGEGKDRNPGSGTNILRCSLCRDKLEDTHFVQCPSIGHHKFCFPCSRDSIKKQGAGSEVFCPSGERCPLQGSNLPWAFMQGEIATILGTEFTVKKEKEN
ncbi:interferon regulatory factor 2-binding protein-like A [Actinia tenebrosa]|uniref:Interferon regulatory factor 2-binding protein-like A n=1 Tax=Actinia tenebrosa TaxID=6105 RepID=A0A6P8IYA3_ACTTE|nr:interferon regulatory factor 2-binding protein-like A [Actinia tenebrosa]